MSSDAQRRRDGEENGRDERRDDKDERRDDKTDDRNERIRLRTELAKQKAAKRRALLYLIIAGVGLYFLISTGSLGFLKNLIGK